MKKLLITFFLGLNLVSFSQTDFIYQKDFKKILELTKDKKSALAYDKLLVRFKTNDTTLTNYEILALLIGYTANPNYKPYGDINKESEIYALNGNKLYAQALDSANKFLQTHPFSLKTLFEKSYSFYKLEQDDSATFYSYQARQILYAMNFSGAGTRESPMFSLGPIDGQDYIYKTGLGKIGLMGSASDAFGNFLDTEEVVTSEGKTYTMYFVIQHATKKMFEGEFDEKDSKHKKKK